LSGGLANIGKTVESFRIALEGEINRWSGFARASRKEDREAFDELMDMCRTYASESSNATNPIVFEPMVVSILLGQQRRILELEKKLKAFSVNIAIVVNPVSAQSLDITIKADGTVEPSTAPIATADKMAYYFASNISGSIIPLSCAPDGVNLLDTKSDNFSTKFSEITESTSRIS
jgi:hypothetical protein